MEQIEVLIVDQFRGPSPYTVQVAGYTFDELLAEAKTQPSWRAEERIILATAKRHDIPWCTTAFKRGPSGEALFHMGNWDSSG